MSYRDTISVPQGKNTPVQQFGDKFFIVTACLPTFGMNKKTTTNVNAV